MGLIRLSPLDASFLHLETRNAYTHIGGLGIFERGGWLLAEERFAALRHHVEARLDVLPRYRHYAPGLDPAYCETGVHALDLATGRVLGSLLWPLGNQLFAIEGVDRTLTAGFPFVPGAEASAKGRIRLFSRGLTA